MATKQATRPMRPSPEATEKQLRLAREQGDALGRALQEMTGSEAHDGGEQRAGDYVVSYAVEKAEGLWHMRDGRLEWVEPTTENVHIEIAVRDSEDGRFLPGLGMHVSVVDANGREVGTHDHPFLWHPWLFHYGRNWEVPGSGTYTIRARIDAPTFPRHDRTNGRRYEEPVEVEFRGVQIETGQK